MKKIYLLIFVFVLFSAAPSFSMKLITNNETNRIVPSRSSLFETEEYMDETNDFMQRQNYNPDIIPGYQADRFENEYRSFLGQSIRKELIGTTWHYPAYYYAKKNNEPQNITENKTDGNIIKNINSKPYIREAADYYIIDTNINPDERIPIGIE